ncbi:4F2 cell-surface antigen heavy chain-like [Xyrauchen texanus]|uniref:4F2 cell-surface antigen heavy chain-like n=1 Tax=Xyrauchen texanus TaxID=154827 RepID=UPI002241AAF6|nr:4F2 cell-surface antigen heavy chain-like [Xyrauchen texanus]
MRDIELNKVDLEKQHINEKNGCVKVRVQEDIGPKITCLSKDELMKIAGTAGWIRARWILLVLFFLGWVGMLAGAIVIILQAPRCKPIPEMNWWNEGLLYQISDVNAFSNKGLKGVEEKLEYLKQMKVKGLILGPIHTVQADQLDTLKLTSIKPEVGTENELETLLDQAHKKGISLVLDLTPNYESVSAWFNNTASVAEKLKEACVYWLNKGFNGISLSGLGDFANTSTWPSIQDITNKRSWTEKTALIVSVTDLPLDDIHVLLNHSGVDLLLTGLPNPVESQALSIQKLYSMNPQTSLGWSLCGRTLGCLASRTPAVPVRLFQILLFTLPGTPLFNAGDEVGLKTGEKLQTMWDLESPADEANATAKTLQEERIALRDFFKALSDLRGKERALRHGEFVSLHSSSSTLAFLRIWDQSERFLIAINWGNSAVNMTFTNSDLPAEAQVCVTTNAENLAVDSMVSLKTLELGSKQAVLLSYPYAG